MFSTKIVGVVWGADKNPRGGVIPRGRGDASTL